MRTDSIPFGRLGCIAATLTLLATTPVHAIDLFPTDLEVTQSIQDLASSMFLVAGRETWVRAYAASDGATGTATAELWGELGGPGGTLVGPLAPTNPFSGYTFVTPAATRADLSGSFQFSLPPSWLSGNLHLRVIIDSLDDVVESDETNNELELTVSFLIGVDAKVAFLDYIHAGAGAPRVVDKLAAISFIGRTYPVRRVDIRASRTLDLRPINLGNDVCNCTRDMAGTCAAPGTCSNIPTLRCSANTDCGCTFLNSVTGILRAADYLNFSGSIGPARKYYGMVNDGGGTAFMRGCAGGHIGSGPAGNPALYTNFSWDTDGSYADWYTAHELGHTWGRPHAPCCGAGGSPAGFPDANCSISSTGDDSFYGWDTLDRSALVPSQNQGDDGNYTDIMSYCPQEWASDFTATKVFQQIAVNADILYPPPGQEPSEYILVRGTVNFDLDVALIGEMQRISSTRIPYETVPSEWSIILRNKQDVDLLEHAFTPIPVEVGQPADPALLGIPLHDTGYFVEIVPYDVDTQRVVIARNGNVLDTFEVSPNSPTVTLLTPNNGGVVQDLVIVDWNAADVDGDPLTASILYSPDAGQSWTTVAVQVPASPFTVDLREMPGSQNARLRVSVTDGFYSASDDSDESFTLVDQGPAVAILTADGSIFQPGANVMLSGIAVDATDGMLSDMIRWYSDMSGFLGIGAFIDAGVLPEGPHVIRAEVNDQLQQLATAEINILVSDQASPVPSLSHFAISLVVVLLALAAWSLLAIRTRNV